MSDVVLTFEEYQEVRNALAYASGALSVVVTTAKARGVGDVPGGGVQSILDKVDGALEVLAEAKFS